MSDMACLQGYVSIVAAVVAVVADVAVLVVVERDDENPTWTKVSLKEA